jgi:hypothetical protein
MHAWWLVARKNNLKPRIASSISFKLSAAAAAS